MCRKTLNGLSALFLVLLSVEINPQLNWGKIKKLNKIKPLNIMKLLNIAIQNIRR